MLFCAATIAGGAFPVWVKTRIYRAATAMAGSPQPADIAKGGVVLRTPTAVMNLFVERGQPAMRIRAVRSLPTIFTRGAGMAYTSSQASFATSATCGSY
jgi:hypothetical protein